MIFKRFIAVFFLIVMLFLICNNYASEEYNIVVNELFFDYHGDHAFISGKVVNIYHDAFEVSINERETYTVYQKKISKVNLEDTTYILGTINSPNEISAIKIMVVKEKSTKFVILRSLFGLILFLLIFGSYWKFDRKSMLFIRRK